jgi:hypothetical protein
MLGGNAEQMKESRDRPCEEVIQDFGEPQLFMHESFLLATGF